MAVSLGRILRAGLIPALLLTGMACKRPETALRERPAQRVELVQKVKGMTPEEERALVARISVGLGLPPAAEVPAGGSTRVLRLTLKGGPDPDAARGLGRTWTVSVGEGFALGAFLASGAPAYTFTSWEVTAIGGGVGAILGAAYGPVRYRENQARMQRFGYLPWGILAEWEVLDRRPGGGEDVAAHTRPANLDPRPFLHPLPAGARTEADVRAATLEATAEALLRKVKGAPEAAR